MSNSQRRALENTIPTTEVVKDAVTYPRERLGEPLDISPERFEAWLAQVRRDAAREALDQAEARIKAVRDVLDQEAPDPTIATRVRADTIRRALDGER